MIELSHIYKTYTGPVHALRDVSFKIAKGEFVFLTGASGAGKTTLFKMIAGFDKPSSGLIEVAGHSISELNHSNIPNFRRQIGVVFQDFKLLKDQTVFQNVALPLLIKNEKQSTITKRVEEVLGQVSLSSKWDEYPEHLSGGEQQRIAIARAMIHKPGLLIADEPTGNLDPQLSFEIMNLFEKICSYGTTVFLATHDHEMVKKRRHRVIHLEQGQLAKSMRSEGLDL